jgi:hypothetical protein
VYHEVFGKPKRVPHLAVEMVNRRGQIRACPINDLSETCFDTFYATSLTPQAWVLEKAKLLKRLNYALPGTKERLLFFLWLSAPSVAPKVRFWLFLGGGTHFQRGEKWGGINEVACGRSYDRKIIFATTDERPSLPLGCGDSREVLTIPADCSRWERWIIADLEESAG